MRGLLILFALISSTTAAQEAAKDEVAFMRAECTREKRSEFRLDELEPVVQDASEVFTISSFATQQQWWVLVPHRDSVTHRYVANQVESPDGQVVTMESKIGHLIVRLSDGSFIHTLPRDLSVDVHTGKCIFKDTGALIELAEPR